MPRDENVFNDMLFRGVSDRNFDLVTAALLAGANVNGPRGRDFPPIVAATVAGHAGMVKFLLGQGADPGRPVTKKVTCPSFSTDATTPGERALHIAARRGNVEIVRLLLKRAGTDLDATDNEGCTPLMAACRSMPVCGEVVRLLLEAGADPALAVGKGFIPLQVVAYRGLTDLVDMLHSRAPSTLNACTATGKTPLSFACSEGHARTVSKLLSLGAMHPKGNDICPLSLAVEKGSVDVVRVLIKEGDVRVATDKIFVMPRTLYLSIISHRARILRLLLMVDGEKKRWEWANKVMNGTSMLHLGAGYGCPGVVSVLLEAGADEATCDMKGRTPRDVIGQDIEQDDEVQMDEGKEVAIRRMLQRGPAYRARSWAWPSDEGVDASGSGGGGTVASAAGGVLSSPPAVKTPLVIGVRIFRPHKKGRSTFLVRLIDRYCAKN